MAAYEVTEGTTVLARHIPAADAWRDGLSFFSPEGDYIQVGTWGYRSGKELLAHAHNEVRREVLVTQEVLYIRRGRISAHIYDTAGRKVMDLTANEGDLLVLLGGGHGYTVLEDGTQVLEIKNGPYPGAETDRRRL